MLHGLVSSPAPETKLRLRGVASAGAAARSSTGRNRLAVAINAPRFICVSRFVANHLAAVVREGSPYRARLQPRLRRGSSPLRSVPRVAGGARKGDRVAHIGEPGRIGDGALKAEPEPGMRHRAVASEIAVPAVMLLVDAALRHAR